MPTRELAVRSTRIPTTSQRLLLLDGQQRVTSLSAILGGEPVQVRNRKRPIEILFNLEHPSGPPTDITEVDNGFTADVEDVEDEETADRDIQEELRKRTFVVASRALQNDPVWIPVSHIFKKSDSRLSDQSVSLRKMSGGTSTRSDSNKSRRSQTIRT